MDEPLSNLDAKLRVQMRTQVARIQKQLGTTMVYVTHDQTEAMTLGDRVAVMRAGIIQQVDTPEHLYEQPDNLFVAGFIGSPAMNFVPAKLEGGKLRLPFGEAPIPTGSAAAERSAAARRDRRHSPRALRGRGDRSRQGPDAVQGEARRRRVDGLRAVRLLRHQGRAGPSPGSSTRSRRPRAWRTSRPGRAERRRAPGRGLEQGRRRAGEVELTLDTSQIKLFDPESGGATLAAAETREAGGPARRRGRRALPGHGRAGSAGR